MPTGGRRSWRACRIVAALRSWFAAEGFIEVETGALAVSPGNETHLHAFATSLVAPDGTRSPLYLRTSPEFACKKLLAAGERRIVEFARVFRNRERGALHHAGIHNGRMVSRRRAVSGVDGRLRSIVGAGGGSGGDEGISFPRPHRRSVRRTGAADGRRSIRKIRRHRFAGDAAGRQARPRTSCPRRAGRRHSYRR